MYAEHEEARDDDRHPLRPAEQRLDDDRERVEVHARDQDRGEREEDRAEQVRRLVEAQQQELGDGADLRAVVEGHHHQAQEDHGGDGADPVPVHGVDAVLRAVGGHAEDLGGAQVGGDERQTGHPGGQRTPGEEEVEAGLHRAAGGEADAEDDDEVDRQDRVVEPVGGEPELRRQVHGRRGGRLCGELDMWGSRIHVQSLNTSLWCSLFGCGRVTRRGDCCGLMCLVLLNALIGYGWRSPDVKKTSTRLADGRELIYYDSRDDTVRDAVDRRPLDRTATTSEVRRDPLLGDAVAIASHRQGRTYHPPADECPLCPSEGDRLSEIPDSSYDVGGLREPLPLARRGLRSLRGRLLHLRPRRVLRRSDRGAGRAGPGGLDRPHRRAVASPLRGAGVLLREPRRRDRRHPRPSARPDLRVPLHHPAHAP